MKNNEKLLLGAIYRSPSSGTENSLRLNQLISTAIGLNFSYTVILGDFNFPNIDWTEWTTNHNETHPEFQFIECLGGNFLSQEIMNPTRYRIGQIPNILDLLLEAITQIGLLWDKRVHPQVDQLMALWAHSATQQVVLDGQLLCPIVRSVYCRVNYMYVIATFYTPPSPPPCKLCMWRVYCFHLVRVSVRL